MVRCRTAAEYGAAHETAMVRLRAAFPALAIRTPWAADPGAQPLVTGGKWVVLCVCGDAPMASPAWDEARCFQCGAIYRGLAWPDDRRAIEALLLQRPQALTRAWLPGETVADLEGENVAHGVAG